MGKTFTPKYRLILTDSTNSDISPMSWKVKEFGPANSQSLEAYVMAYAKSLELPNGCNKHISLSLGFVPYPTAAAIVRQSDNQVVAIWKAAMFQVW